MEKTPSCELRAEPSVSATSPDGPSDEALISRLRDGDNAAYTELWRRHVTAALRLGNRLLPGHGEDLVSDSFLAVYQQITVSGGGPDVSFRAYLFTVIRNSAQRLHRERQKVVTVSELEQLVDRVEPAATPLELLEEESTSAELLDALTALPERWQRVLWLSEVEDVGRAQIAKDLGIKPNAVSSLQKRARTGLRMNWLTLRIPVELRDDTAHAAHLLPRLIVDGRAAGLSTKASCHLGECTVCAEVDKDLRASYGQLTKVTLSLAGFTALVGTAPALAPPVAIGLAATVGATGILATAIAASIGLVFAGGVATSHFLGAEPDQTVRSKPTQTDSATKSSADSSTSGGERTGVASSVEKAVASDRVPETSSPGRHNTDQSVMVLDFSEGSTYSPPPHQRPQKAEPGTIPDPARSGTGEGPASAPQAIDPGLSTPPSSHGYLAPTIFGHTTPGSSVAVELTRPAAEQYSTNPPIRYSAVVQADGTWAFDFATLELVKPGRYSYDIWAYTDTETSQATHGDFTI